MMGAFAVPVALGVVAVGVLIRRARALRGALEPETAVDTPIRTSVVDGVTVTWGHRQVFAGERPGLDAVPLGPSVPWVEARFNPTKDVHATVAPFHAELVAACVSVGTDRVRVQAEIADEGEPVLAETATDHVVDLALCHGHDRNALAERLVARARAARPDSAPRLRYARLISLHFAGTPAVTRAAPKLAEFSTGIEQLYWTHSLGMRGVEALRRFAVATDDDHLRATALKYLAEFGVNTVLRRAVIEGLEAGAQAEFAAAALDHGAAAMEAVDVAPLLHAARAHAGPGRVAAMQLAHEALRRLSASERNAALAGSHDALAQVATLGDIVAGRLAVELLDAAESRDVVGPLLARLRDGDGDERLFAAWALGQLGAADALGDLSSLAGSPFTNARLRDVARDGVARIHARLETTAGRVALFDAPEHGAVSVVEPDAD